MSFEDFVLVVLLQRNGVIDINTVAQELRAAGFRVGKTVELEAQLIDAGFIINLHWKDGNVVRRTVDV